ncbi:sulfatase-like hydrolase/transferase [Maribacter aquimaris]|uniref:sulfatase-like hydrolase/transferase n=1 Tax=Maribacter aquimaris TaxID=2737171 RepID=UPI0021D0F879|nr:sulfatase-like hydrolase/transferase [Maribacter aquimaris]
MKQKDEPIQEEIAKQPNIMVLLCDDLRYGDLSSFGHPIIQTKNLDKLAAYGIKLTNFYASAPVYSPSLVGLLTGRSPNRAGCMILFPD